MGAWQGAELPVAPSAVPPLPPGPRRWPPIDRSPSSGVPDPNEPLSIRTPSPAPSRADMCVRVGLDVDFSLKQLKALSVPSLSHGFLLPVRSLVPLNWG